MQKNLAQKFKIENSKHASTPLGSNDKFTKYENRPH